MNGLREGARDLVITLAERAAAAPFDCDIVVCPPATLLAQTGVGVRHSPIALGAQDCHQEPSGAHTGDISAEMLADAGCSYVIVGHSERRADLGETDATVKAKAQAAHRAGLTAIVCIGETEEQRDAGEARAVVERQLAQSLPTGAGAANTAIAYEPVWAIGTGRTPSVAEVAEIHGHLRSLLTARLGDDGSAMRVLYGGSVKPENAAELMAVADVDGALVGGASLEAETFLPIIEALVAAKAPA